MIIPRYLMREIFHTLMVVTTVLLLALLCQQIVRYLNYVAIGKIPTGVLMQLVAFEVPYLLAFLLPLGLYLGILLAYGRLYTDNEMAILQMYGFGNRRIFRLTAFMGFLVGLIVLMLMLWVNPWISALRQQVMSSDEATVHLVQTMIPGRFQVSPNGTHVMYIEKLTRDRERAENIFLAQEVKTLDDNEQPAWKIVYAKEGYQVKDTDSDDQFFITEDGYRYEGKAGQNDFKIIQYKKYTLRIPQNEMRVTHLEDETLSTWQLWKDYENPKRAAEFQWRFSIAISAFLLALLAVPLSAVRPRQGRYLALIPAALIYIVYINLLFIARHWVQQGEISTALGMWWVHAIVLFFILVIMGMRGKKWLRSKKS